MDPSVRRAIVGIEIRHDEAVIRRGTASLIGDRLLMTALHVVADRTTDPPGFVEGTIQITFTNQVSTVASVVADKWNALEDWVLLTCEAVPPDVSPLRLATIDGDGAPWTTYGFPEAEQDGLTIHGTVTNSHAELFGQGVAAYQLFSPEVAAASGLRVKGLSGAPVLVHGAVVGVIRRAPLSGERAEAGTLFACPASQIAAGCPDYFPDPLKPITPPSPWRKRLVAATVAVVAAAVTTVFVARRLRTPPPIMNQEIVLDTSSGMADPFDTMPSKLAAAVAALRARTLHPAENLALRTFGGECQADEESRLLVPFGVNRRRRIVSATDGLAAGGRPTLVSGIISALADVHPLPHTRRIVVITGHADACYEEAINEVKQRFKAQQPFKDKKDEVVLEMRFIGLALSGPDESKVRKISEAVGGEAHFVRTVAQLNDVLQYVIEFEPALRHVNDVWNVVNKVADGLREMRSRTIARRFDEALKTLAASEALYDKLRPSFDSLANVTLSSKFERFYELAAENRVLQKQIFPAARAWIDTGPGIENKQAPDFEQKRRLWKEAIGRWNEILDKYNRNVNEMNRLTDEIVKETRRTG